MTTAPARLVWLAALAGLASLLVGLLAGHHDRCRTIYCLLAPCPQPPCDTVTAWWSWVAAGAGGVLLVFAALVLVARGRARPRTGRG